MTGVASAAGPEVLDRTRRLVTYLSDLVQKRDRTLDSIKDSSRHLWLDEYRACVWSEEGAVGLRLQRPIAPEPPTPPNGLLDYLAGSWEDPDTPTPGLLLDDLDPASAGLGRAYESWVEARERWVDGCRTSQVRYRELESEELSDTHELVLGVGLISRFGDGSWTPRRHLLVLPVTATAISTGVLEGGLRRSVRFGVGW
jgi:hypothetical protein